MTAVAVGIALNHDGLSVIEQDLLGDSTKVMAGLFDALQPVFLTLVLGEPDVSGATKFQRGHKGFDLAPVTVNGRKVDLHLLARRRLKANHGIRLDGFEVGNVVLEPANPAGIAAILNLS